MCARVQTDPLFLCNGAHGCLKSDAPPQSCVLVFSQVPQQESFSSRRDASQVKNAEFESRAESGESVRKPCVLREGSQGGGGSGDCGPLPLFQLVDCAKKAFSEVLCDALFFVEKVSRKVRRTW